MNGPQRCAIREFLSSSPFRANYRDVVTDDSVDDKRAIGLFENRLKIELSGGRGERRPGIRLVVS
jgi:hypothetical protein